VAETALTAPNRPTTRQVVAVIVRVLLVTAALLVAYFNVPLDRETSSAQIAMFVAGLAGFVVVIVFQVRRILEDESPRLRAVQALGTALPVFVVIFSLAYVVMGRADPANFNQPVNRVTGLYFTVTVLATVGFGDVAAQTDVARIFVTIQMILDLILVGVVAKVIVGASRVGVERRRAEAEASASHLDETTPERPS